MSSRSLTKGEKTLLRTVFADTLPYFMLEVSVNDIPWSLGGEDNSITPFGVPRMAPTIWKADYSATPMNRTDTGIFVHEFMHVWQNFHGESNAWNFIKTGIWNSGVNWGKLIDHCRRNGCKSSTIKVSDFQRSYDDAYNYKLESAKSLWDFNFEAQAQIVEDYWLMSNGGSATRNKGTKTSLSDYAPFIEQVRKGGAPRLGGVPLPTKD